MAHTQHRWWRRGAAGMAAAATIALGITMAAPASAAGAYATTVDVTAVTAADGLTLAVSGSGFTDLPKTSTGKDAAAVYVALRDPATMSNDAINANPRLVPAVSPVMLPQIAAGAWSTTLTAPAASLDKAAHYEVVTWAGHGGITDATLLTTTPVTLTAAQLDALFGAAPATTAPATTATPEASPISAPAEGSMTTMAEPPSAVPAAAPQCTAENVPATAGTPRLHWGIKSSFIGYVESGVSDGKVTASGGAARVGDSFTWGAGTGSLAGGSGTMSFTGAVNITGHGGVLNVTVSNLRIKATSATAGILVADVKSSDMDGNPVSATGATFANLIFSGLSADGGTATATVSTEGAAAFAGFYKPGDALDPLTISISGATAAHTVQRCVDAEGNAVNPDGTPLVAGLAETGVGTASMTAFALTLTGAGVLLLVFARRRRVATATH